MTTGHGLSTVRQDGVLIMTFDRPHVRNAIDEPTARALAEALAELDSDTSLTVGVLTGAGGVFCAGMDLNAYLAGQSPTVGDRGFAGITERPPIKPIIAAVEGAAVGGGFEIVLACDLIVAAKQARFGLPEVKRGLVAAAGGLLRLPQRIPYHVAMEWSLTGALISAERAAEVGLVNQLVPEGDAARAALVLAATISANAPLAVAATKRIVVESGAWSDETAFDRQRAIWEPVQHSLDAREGASAFREKRSPVWLGR